MQLLDDRLKAEARFFARHGLIELRDNKLSLTPAGLELFAELAEGPAKERLIEHATLLAMGEKVQEDPSPAAVREFLGRVQRFADTEQELDRAKEELATANQRRSRGKLIAAGFVVAAVVMVVVVASFR